MDRHLQYFLLCGKANHLLFKKGKCFRASPTEGKFKATQFSHYASIERSAMATASAFILVHFNVLIFMSCIPGFKFEFVNSFDTNICSLLRLHYSCLRQRFWNFYSLRPPLKCFINAAPRSTRINSNKQIWYKVQLMNNFSSFSRRQNVLLIVRSQYR
jgi:hypothetical protein